MGLLRDVFSLKGLFRLVFLASLALLAYITYVRYFVAVPRDCKFGDWTAWTGCHSEGCPAGHEIRVRGIVQTAAYGGKTCPTDPQHYVQRRPCAASYCKQFQKGGKDPGGGPKDCKYTDWSPWSKCPRCKKQSCHYPTQFRIRSVAQRPSEGGRPCSWREMIETAICGPDKTPVCPQKQNCTFGDAYVVRQECPRDIVCMPPPGVGKQMNYHRVLQKPILSPAKNGGTCDVSSHTKTEPCQFPQCPACPPLRKKCSKDCKIVTAFSECSMPCKPVNGSPGYRFVSRVGQWNPQMNYNGQCPLFKSQSCCTQKCPTKNANTNATCPDMTDVEVRRNPSTGKTEYRVIAPEHLRLQYADALGGKCCSQNFQRNNAACCKCSGNLADVASQHKDRRPSAIDGIDQPPPGDAEPGKYADSQENSVSISASPPVAERPEDAEAFALTDWKTTFPTQAEQTGAHIVHKLRAQLRKYGVKHVEDVLSLHRVVRKKT